MLNSRSLWFSHIKYMNDADEWFYALRLFEQVLEEYKGAFRGPYEIVKGMASLHDHFTFSFSEEKDLLSQWRGYCPHGGYSYCLDDSLLDQFVQEHELVFEPCIYEEEAQREFIKTRIIGMRPEYIAEQQQNEAERVAKGEYIHYSIDRTIYEVSQNLVPKFYLLCLLKHPSFKEEREWRMVGSFVRSNGLRMLMKLRPSRNMLIPYLDLPLPVGQDALDPQYPDRRRLYRWKINEVVVSPQPHQELAMAALKLAVPEYIGNYIGAITASAIPYINW